MPADPSELVHRHTLKVIMAPTQAYQHLGKEVPAVLTCCKSQPCADSLCLLPCTGCCQRQMGRPRPNSLHAQSLRSLGSLRTTVRIPQLSMA
jgi:hypothetical protein